MRNFLFAFFTLTFFSGLSSFSQTNPAEDETRLLRFPTIYKDKVVFSYSGDLYIVDRAGGTARKLTSDPGYEIFPKFSNNGQTIAFTGQYDGNTEVFTIPASGGEAKRLTITPTLGRDELSDRMGPNNIVMAWSRDNNSIIYRSRMNTFNAFKGSLYSVNVNGGQSIQLPLSYGSWCSWSPDGKKLAFNKVFREFRTWKYYQGGMADDIWIFDTEKKTVERIFENVAQDIMPMWSGDKIYFISDRDRTMNLFVYNIENKAVAKVTNFTEFDIKYPSINGDDIIFENGGYLYVYQTSTGKLDKLKIKISDDQEAGRDKWVDASKNINTYSLSPDGHRIAIGAHGDVFSVPAPTGVTRNLTRSSGAHERNVIWSPDGKSIAFISDQTGEDEIYIIPQAADAPDKKIQLTKNSDTYKFQPMWSPDSKYILWGDKMLRLHYVDVNTKEVILVDKSDSWEISSFSWSPDSRYISYSKPEVQTKERIFIFDTQSKKSTPVTDNWYESTQPVFSPDGKYLYFVSERDFHPIYSATEWNHAYTDMAKIYMILLDKNTPSPFATENHEVKIDAEKDSVAASTKTTITWEGISDRILSLPGDAGNYFNLYPAKGKIFYFKRIFTDKKNSLCVYDLKDKKETKIGEADNFILSENKKKMLVVSEKNYYVIETPGEKLELKDKVDLEGMKMWVNRTEEWNQIFNECWRQMRDFFYDPGMHGVDWKAMREKYKPLIPYVNSRADLTYVIGEMISELNIGHAYVGGGDLEPTERIGLGLLGAEIEKQENWNYALVKKVYDGENWTGELRSPLLEPGVNVTAGTYILAVNGRLVSEVKDFNELMIYTANRPTELTVNSTNSMAGSRKVIIKPLDDQSNLLYYNWVEQNVAKVNEATKGRVGYIHVPDMGPGGLNEFMKHFYPQLNKDALIIDLRGNGGGNVSPMIIERLKRELDMINMARNTTPTPNPGEMLLGPLVEIVDQYTVSDGDLFTFRFKHNHLGPVVGQRTWGGITGIRGTLPLVDGGFMNRPEFGKYAPDGKSWHIEGYGVDPDIFVENDPYVEFTGVDQQLNKSIEVILKELETKGKKLAPPPPYPDKSR